MIIGTELVGGGGTFENREYVVATLCLWVRKVTIFDIKSLGQNFPIDFLNLLTGWCCGSVESLQRSIFMTITHIPKWRDDVRISQTCELGQYLTRDRWLSITV